MGGWFGWKVGGPWGSWVLGSLGPVRWGSLEECFFFLQFLVFPNCLFLIFFYVFCFFLFSSFFFYFHFLVLLLLLLLLFLCLFDVGSKSDFFRASTGGTPLKLLFLIFLPFFSSPPFGAPPPDRPKFRVFSLSRHNVHYFSPLLRVFSWNFGGV